MTYLPATTGDFVSNATSSLCRFMVTLTVSFKAEG